MPAPTYPPTRTDPVVDLYHGTPVPDPYRWLEDSQSAEVQTWVAAQNALTADFTHHGMTRANLQARLTTLWDFARHGLYQKAGPHYFFQKNDGLQNQAVLYRQTGLDGTPTVVLDPNALSASGTIALIAQVHSPDGAYLVYSLARDGSDWQTYHVRRIADNQDLPEVLHWCKFTTIAWRADNSGFFYSRLPDPATVAPEDQSNYMRVYWHALNTPQSEDVLIYERPDEKELGFSPIMTEDDRYLLLHVWHGTDPQSRIYYRPVNERAAPFTRLLDEADALYDFIGSDGATFFFHTDLHAARGRVIAINLAHPERAHWREIIPEAEHEVIAFSAFVHNHIVLVTLRDAHHHVYLHTLDGTRVREIVLPTLGTVMSLQGRNAHDEFFILFQSYLYAPSVLRYDFNTEALTTLITPTLDFDSSAYTTEQVFYTSRDGTRVPLFLTHKRGLVRDGTNPVILYGYGGFTVNMTPFFSVGALLWLEHGGVFAVANLRGGNEYGEAWHRAGMLANKQNVFDDFIAAGEWLCAQGYTTPRRLASMGGSNGGLLVSACALQRPDLFGAVICQVPVTDMLRYHRFTVGRYWVGEYGNAEADPEHFRFLYAYSPLHNAKPGTTYPAMLIMAADTDDRVVPAHAKKFAATLQAAQAGPAPILLRIAVQAGHGLGKPTRKLIEEQSDLYAFLLKIFDLETIAEDALA